MGLANPGDERYAKRRHTVTLSGSTPIPWWLTSAFHSLVNSIKPSAWRHLKVTAQGTSGTRSHIFHFMNMPAISCYYQRPFAPFRSEVVSPASNH
eukprot:1143694-Pelagomonas_calceolata.AAC.3